PQSALRSGSGTRQVARTSRIAIGIRRTIAALQPDLVRTVRRRPIDEELLVEGNAAFRLGVQLAHPALHTIRIELLVDDAVERVGEVDAPAIAADLDHLRPAIQRATLGPGMGG